MSAYIILQINIINKEPYIINKEPYKEYLKKVTPIVKKYWGKYIARGGSYKIMLGKWDYERTVIIKFSTFDNAITWYNSSEYSPVKKIREDNSEGNAIIIEGL